MSDVDVVVSGAGPAALQLVAHLQEKGLRCAVVSENFETEVPPDFSYIGRLVVTGDRQVTVLDPATGDERRVIRCRALVVTSLIPTSALGLAKFGLTRNDDRRLPTDDAGQTCALWVFATGDAAHASKPLDPAQLAQTLHCTLTAPA